MQRSVSSFRAWYFGVLLVASDRRPLAPLHGELMKTASGRWLRAAWRTSSAVASRQPAGGSTPWKAVDEVGNEADGKQEVVRADSDRTGAALQRMQQRYEEAEHAAIPLLPSSARQPRTVPECVPTCSGGFGRLLDSMLPRPIGGE